MNTKSIWAYTEERVANVDVPTVLIEFAQDNLSADSIGHDENQVIISLEYVTTAIPTYNGNKSIIESIRADFDNYVVCYTDYDDNVTEHVTMLLDTLEHLKENGFNQVILFS